MPSYWWTLRFNAAAQDGTGSTMTCRVKFRTSSLIRTRAEEVADELTDEILPVGWIPSNVRIKRVYNRRVFAAPTPLVNGADLQGDEQRP